MTKTNEQVEIAGLKGMKSAPFTKTFKDLGAFDKWLEKHGDNVTIYATRVSPSPVWK